MKKYPYTDSTEIIKYEPKEKKKNRFKKFIPCIMSAVLASVITAGAVGVGGYYYLKPIKTNETASVAVQQNTASSGMTTLSGINGKKELTVPEIAKKVGPSCVGVINKAKVQPTKYYDPFSGRYFYSSDPNSGKLVEQGSGSGIIISEDGYIATNQHVIADATEINVILNT